MMNATFIGRRNFSGPVQYKQVDYRTMSITLLGTNNQTLEGTVNLTSLLIGGEEEEAYDAEGAAYYVCAVILVYGLSIVLLIGSLAKKKMQDKGQDKEEKQINTYLHKAPDLREMSARDNYRQLKRNIITLVSNTTPASTPSISAKGPPSLSSPESPRKNVGSLETLLEERSRQASMEREDNQRHTTVNAAGPSTEGQHGPANSSQGSGPPLRELAQNMWSKRVDAEEPPRETSSPLSQKAQYRSSLAAPSLPAQSISVDRSPKIPRSNKSHPGWPNPFEADSGQNKVPKRDPSPSKEKGRQSPTKERPEFRYQDERPTLVKGLVSVTRAKSRSPDRSNSPLQRSTRPPKLQPFTDRDPTKTGKSDSDIRRPVARRADPRSHPASIARPRPHPGHAERAQPTEPEVASPARGRDRRSRSPGSRKPGEHLLSLNFDGPPGSSQQAFSGPSRPGDRRSRSPQPPYLSPYADDTPMERPTSLVSPTKQPTSTQTLTPPGMDDEPPRRYRPSQPYAGRHGQWPKRRRSASPSNPLLRGQFPGSPREQSPCPSETEELLQVTCV